MTSKFAKGKRFVLSCALTIVPLCSFGQSFHPAVTEESPETVRLWEHGSEGGGSTIFPQGVYAFENGFDNFGVVGNNSASSIRVGASATAALCSDFNFDPLSDVYNLGFCHLIPEGTPNIIAAPYNFNDQASSLIVAGSNGQRSATGFTAWRGGNFNNQSTNFLAGAYDSNQLGAVGNNQLSSIRVEPGFFALLCSNSIAEAQTSTGGSLNGSNCALFPEGDFNGAALTSQGLNDQVSLVAAIRVETNPARIGSYGEVRPWPYPAIHQYMLIDGRVMFSQSSDEDGLDEGTVPWVPADGDIFSQGVNRNSTAEYAIWDPVTDEIVLESTFAPGTNLFCGAYTHLPNGNLFGVATGGGGNNVDLTMEYDVIEGRWTLAPTMHLERYYPSVTTTAAGSLLVTGGNDFRGVYLNGHPEFGQVTQPEAQFGGVTIPEVYEDGSWRLLPDAEINFSDIQGPTNDSSYWAWVQQAPNGRMFMAGPDVDMSWIDIEGQGNIDGAGSRFDATTRTYGSYAMYDIGKILFSGGGGVGGSTANTSAQSISNPLASSGVVDITGDTAVVEQVDDMNYARRQHNMTILADGTVLVNGGLRTGQIQFNLAGSVPVSEVWDPETEQWSIAHDAQRPRQYHSTAMLIPDGRVVTAGTSVGRGFADLPGNVAAQERNAELFSPAYLFNDDGSLAERPVIEDVSSVWTYNNDFEVEFSNTDVVSANMIKIGAVTHSTNFTQRLIPLEVAGFGNNSISLTAPENANIAPPGHYFLFLLNSDGVPSVAEIVQVTDQGSVVESDFLVGNPIIDNAFNDAHNPFINISESDNFIQGNQAGSLVIDSFNFYARQLGNPLTPLVVRVNGDNDFTVIAIGDTRTQSEYSVGVNNFPFSDSGAVEIDLAANEEIAVGFMDSFPNGSGWGLGTVIPADTGNGGDDELYALGPAPLILANAGFVSGRRTASVALNQTLVQTNNTGLNANNSNRLRANVNLNRSYSFSIGFSESNDGGNNDGGNNDGGNNETTTVETTTVETTTVEAMTAETTMVTTPTIHLLS